MVYGVKVRNSFKIQQRSSPFIDEWIPRLQQSKNNQKHIGLEIKISWLHSVKTLGNEQKIGSHSSSVDQSPEIHGVSPQSFAQWHVMIGVLEVLRHVGASTQHAGQARGNDHRLSRHPWAASWVGTRTGKPQIRSFQRPKIAVTLW